MRVPPFGRRLFLLAAGLPRAVAAASPAEVTIRLDSQSLAALPGDVRAGLRVTGDTSPAAQAMLRNAPPDRAVPLIFIVVGVLALPVLWRTVRDMALQYQYGGVVIDLRQTPVAIAHDRAIPSSLVVVVHPDGKVERMQDSALEENLLGRLLGRPVP